MGDIWPYGKPVYTTWLDVRDWLEHYGMSSRNAAIGAAICEAESSFDLSVINDTPATGDYSVGMAQINYLGSLYAERTKLFGTPEQLIKGGVSAQAKALYTLWRDSGFTPWSTFNDGEYKKYLNGNVAIPQAPGQQTAPIAAPTDPGTDSWAGYVKGSAGHFTGASHMLVNAGKTLDTLRR